MIEVVIIGAGIVGLSTALALAQAGFSVTIVETRPHPEVIMPNASEPFDIKVVAISRSSQQFFKSLNIWEKIVNGRACAYQHMTIWDSVADGIIHFSAADFFEPDLGHIIEQRVILAALWQAIKMQSNVTIIPGTHLVEMRPNKESVELLLSSGMTFHTALLIGADGALSTVRKCAQIETTAWDYQQSAIIATVEGKKSHQQTAFQRFAPDGPLALLPLAQTNQSSIVWTTSPERALDLSQQPTATFNKTLTRETDDVMGDFEVVSSRMVIPLRTHHTKQYAKSRCVLVGDAAHTLHPLAGQGVNLGLLDATSLVDKLITAKNRDRDMGSMKVLQRYERERRMHNQMMIWGMEAFKRGFGSRSQMVQRLRNVGLNWVDKQLSVKQFFAKLAMGTLSTDAENHII
ncbi:MAG: UbiH/UbiF/VisC/COQ6 family ubiquinone biosynthesis hydroxylase [Candidatus Berkiellales bacterium]